MINSYPLIIISILSICFVSSCGSSKKSRALADTYPYQASSQYTSTLKSCAQVSTPVGSCNLNKLPTLGMEVPSPTIEDVMSRVIVSHDWMGNRFEELLNVLPSDILQLLGAVTVIAIDADIRPAYYHKVTGAIYLDPASLWMTQEEKNTINRTADYREAYAKPMAFRPVWRLTKNSSDAYNYYNFDSDEDRPFDDIIIPMAALLFHELAHANDILPPSSYDSIDRSKSIYSATLDQASNIPSKQLKEQHPLSSSDMFNLANIFYQGQDPSPSDKQITAAEAGAFFEPDAANDDYSYISQYEDLAMLFEEAMLKHHFNTDRDTGFITQPEGATTCNDYKVGWAVRNRIGADHVKQRAQFVVEQLLPNQDYSAFFAQLELPAQLSVNVGWCDSKTLPNTPEITKIQTLSRQLTPLRPDHINRSYRVQQ